MQERLQKILAEAGIASRRAAERMIVEGRVSVNGLVSRELGVKADPDVDEVAVDGKLIKRPEAFEYYAVNKPVGVVSTVSDERDRPTVVSFVKSKARLYPVGRLDEDSRGLILLTNDGEFSYRLTHPKFEHTKTYEVMVEKTERTIGEVTTLMAYLKKGIRLVEGLAKVDGVSLVPSPTQVILEITLHQGWKRQIRRMIEASGWRVMDLNRIAIGSVRLGELKAGEHRPLSQQEIESFK